MAEVKIFIKTTPNPQGGAFWIKVIAFLTALIGLVAAALRAYVVFFGGIIP